MSTQLSDVHSVNFPATSQAAALVQATPWNSLYASKKRHENGVSGSSAASWDHSRWGRLRSPIAHAWHTAAAWLAYCTSGVLGSRMFCIPVISSCHFILAINASVWDCLLPHRKTPAQSRLSTGSLLPLVGIAGITTKCMVTV